MDAKTAMLEAFSTIADPRRAHGRVHRLVDILVIAVCATFSGADSCEELAADRRQLTFPISDN